MIIREDICNTYQVPSGLSSGTTITMEAQVVNKNTLSKSATLALKVQ
ncbi:hypothetical protein [Pedobacter sp. BS3]|nr:hypothetical protein [Pedobacter sp. BS3]